MGGSLNPATDNPEFVNTPRHEFNFWMDPEAADAVLHANWRKITCTPVDISIRTRLTQAMVDEIGQGRHSARAYVAKYYMHGPGADFMWDELAAAAWIDPSIITQARCPLHGVDTDHGAAYGNTLTWALKENVRPAPQKVEIQFDLDGEKFYKMFTSLMTAPTPAR